MSCYSYTSELCAHEHNALKSTTSMSVICRIIGSSYYKYIPRDCRLNLLVKYVQVTLVSIEDVRRDILNKKASKMGNVGLE